MDNDIKKETRHYKSKKNSDIVNFPVLFRQNALSIGKNPEIVEAPISSYRILFKVLNNISYDQFQEKKQPSQLELFEKDFLTEHNTYSRFTMNIKDIDKNRDYEGIKKGLEFLENLDKGWHTSKNREGKKIKSYGGVISNPSVSKGKITFLMSSHWISQLLKIPNYNQAYIKIPWKLKKGKHVLFYLWLLEVDSTRINYKKFQEAYGYNYKNAQDTARYALRNLKDNLDRYSNVSFNYSTQGDLIYIKKYYTKDVELDLDKKTVNKQQITQKLHYWKNRHKLNTEDISILKSIINLDGHAFHLFKNAYKIFIENCRSDKEKATEYTGKRFIKLFQDVIKEAYKDSPWSGINENGYPIITEEPVQK